jgi:hypothetical protein
VYRSISLLVQVAEDNKGNPKAEVVLLLRFLELGFPGFLARFSGLGNREIGDPVIG